MRESNSEAHESIEDKKYGSNVTVHNYWIRHTQKQSAEVFNKDVTAISSSAISSGGAERAESYGQTLDKNQTVLKRYVSDSDRTNQTLDAILEGRLKDIPEQERPDVKSMRAKEELVAYGPGEWLKLYDQKWTANKKQILESQGQKLEDFSALTPDEQERIAEDAEEPVIREWLDDPNSELAKLHPPRNAAAKFAALFNRRHDRLAKKLYDESEVDIAHVTHKTVTEPFLASGVLIHNTDGARITTIDQLGGSLRILDNWESETTTDGQGNPTTKIIIRGEEYHLDPAMLAQLAEEGIEQLRDSGFAKQSAAQKKFTKQ
jgi:broad specificity phosphatase PhoE